MQGRVLLGASDTYAAGTTGGSATHTLTEAELPEVNTDVVFPQSDYRSLTMAHYDEASPRDIWAYRLNNYELYNGKECSQARIFFGGNQPHSILNPYRAAYIWRKISN